jgi:hypothetical protein
MVHYVLKNAIISLMLYKRGGYNKIHRSRSTSENEDEWVSNISNR